MQETFWHKVGSISPKGSWDIVIFVLMQYLVTAPGGPSWHIYFHLILKQLNARIILTQVWSKSIKWLLRYCHFMFSAIFRNGGHLGVPENQNGFIQETSWTKLDQFQPMILEILSSFSCLSYF